MKTSLIVLRDMFLLCMLISACIFSAQGEGILGVFLILLGLFLYGMTLFEPISKVELTFFGFFLTLLFPLSLWLGHLGYITDVADRLFTCTFSFFLIPLGFDLVRKMDPSKDNKFLFKFINLYFYIYVINFFGYIIGVFSGFIQIHNPLVCFLTAFFYLVLVVVGLVVFWIIGFGAYLKTHEQY